MQKYLSNRQENEVTYLQVVEEQVDTLYKQVEEQMQGYRNIMD
jgi:hypothetical protein